MQLWIFDPLFALSTLNKVKFNKTAGITPQHECWQSQASIDNGETFGSLWSIDKWNTTVNRIKKNTTIYRIIMFVWPPALLRRFWIRALILDKAAYVFQNHIVHFDKRLVVKTLKNIWYWDQFFGCYSHSDTERGAYMYFIHQWCCVCLILFNNPCALSIEDNVAIVQRGMTWNFQQYVTFNIKGDPLNSRRHVLMELRKVSMSAVCLRRQT